MEIGNSNYKGHKQIICISKKEEGPRFSLSLEKKGITHCCAVAKITSTFPINRIALEVQILFMKNTEFNFTDANHIHSSSE